MVKLLGGIAAFLVMLFQVELRFRTRCPMCGGLWSLRVTGERMLGKERWRCRACRHAEWRTPDRRPVFR